MKDFTIGVGTMIHRAYRQVANLSNTTETNVISQITASTFCDGRHWFYLTQNLTVISYR